MPDNMTIALCGFPGAGKDSVADFLTSEFGFTKVPFAAPLKRVCGKLFGLSHDQMHNPRAKEAPMASHQFPFRNLTHFLSMVDEATAEVYGIRFLDIIDANRAAVATVDVGSTGDAKRTVDAVLHHARLNAMLYLVPLLWTSSRVWGSAPNQCAAHPRKLMQTVGSEIYRFVHEASWTFAWGKAAGTLGHVAVTDCRYANEAATIKARGGVVVRVDSTHSWVSTQDQHSAEREFLKFDVDAVVQNHLGLPELREEVIQMMANLFPHRGVIPPG